MAVLRLTVNPIETLYRGGFEDEDYMKILVCRVWTRRNSTAFVVNFHCATNAHFQKKKDEIPGWKAEKFVAYCVPSSKEPFGGENAFAVCVSFSLFRSRKNVLYFELARAYYICMNHHC